MTDQRNIQYLCYTTLQCTILGWPARRRVSGIYKSAGWLMWPSVSYFLSHILHSDGISHCERTRNRTFSKFKLLYAQGCKCVNGNATGCGFEEMKYMFKFIFSFLLRSLVLVLRQSAALSSATQHVMPREFGGKWGSECLNNRLPLCTLIDTP